MKPPFKFSWELVTPAIAREMLTHNPKKQNRNLKERSVRGFAADMITGNWSPSHQGIAFDINGNLIDGQNRLSAIVRSGVPVPFLVCRGVPKRIAGVKSNVMDTLDRGTSRTISDVLKISHGHSANPNIVAGICAMIPRIIVFHQTGTHESKRIAKVTLSQTLAVIELYRKSLQFIAENPPSTIALRAAPIGAAVAIGHAVEPAKTEEFYQFFATGAGIDADSPILAVRNRCLNEPIGRSSARVARLELAMQVLHAIHAFVKGSRLERFGKIEAKTAAHYFIDQQAKNVAAIERIFPSFDGAAAQITTGENWKPSPAAERLLASKAMSERIHGKGLGSRAAKMQKRIARGELKGAVK